jgi:hypothetical protein
MEILILRHCVLMKNGTHSTWYGWYSSQRGLYQFTNSPGEGNKMERAPDTRWYKSPSGLAQAHKYYLRDKGDLKRSTLSANGWKEVEYLAVNGDTWTPNESMWAPLDSLRHSLDSMARFRPVSSTIARAH